MSLAALRNDNSRQLKMCFGSPIDETRAGFDPVAWMEFDIVRDRELYKSVEEHG